MTNRRSVGREHGRREHHPAHRVLRRTVAHVTGNAALETHPLKGARGSPLRVYA
jgi:hypothetical protein